MALYRVSGADRETGKPSALWIRAEHSQAASDQANAQGIVVSRVELADEPQTPAKPDRGEAIRDAIRHGVPAFHSRVQREQAEERRAGIDRTRVIERHIRARDLRYVGEYTTAGDTINGQVILPVVNVARARMSWLYFSQMTAAVTLGVAFGIILCFILVITLGFGTAGGLVAGGS